MGIIWDLCPALSIAPDDTKRKDYTSHEQLSLVSWELKAFMNSRYVF